jgi:hypothetical protein
MPGQKNGSNAWNASGECSFAAVGSGAKVRALTCGWARNARECGNSLNVGRECAGARRRTAARCGYCTTSVSWVACINVVDPDVALADTVMV